MLHHRAGRAAERGGEVHPGDQRGVSEDRVGQAFGRYASQAAEEDAEDDHRHEWLDHRPGRADRGLLIADLEIAPDEEVEQLAVLPELTQVETNPAAGWADQRLGR